MPIYHSFDSNGRMIAQIIQNKGNRAPEAWRAAAGKMGNAWLDWIKVLSSVQYASTKQLAEMGHPYGRANFRGSARSRRGSGGRAALPMPAYYINKQSGKLFSGWHVNFIERGDQMEIRVTNDQKYFGYLASGTKFMISRPILSVALARTQGARTAIYREAQMQVHGYSPLGK